MISNRAPHSIFFFLKKYTTFSKKKIFWSLKVVLFIKNFKFKMCLTKKLNDLKCTSPRRQHLQVGPLLLVLLFLQKRKCANLKRIKNQKFLQKPKLSRRIIKSNKVNLNLYWSLFEVMSTNGEPITTFEVLHRD